MQTGFVGLGDQGGPIAERIAAAGHPLTVWARRPETLASFEALGARSARDVAALAAQSDIFAICVRDDAGVIEVARAALPMMAAGATVVIHSTVHPDTCRMLAAEAGARGVAVIDAPVSGGGAGARAGTLTVMVGGPEAALDHCRPVFESFAALIVRVGDVGAGQLAKLVNNAMMAANLAVAHEAAKIGAGLGLDPAALRQIISASSGRSFAHDSLARALTLATFAFGAGLLRKDVRLLEEVGAAQGLSVGGLAGTANPFLDAVEAAVAATTR